MKVLGLLNRFPSLLLSRSGGSFILLMLAFIISVNANTNAQTVTLKRDRISVKQLFQEIRRQIGCDIVFESKLINNLPDISIDANATPLASVLRNGLRGSGLDFVIEGKTVSIFPSKTNALSGIQQQQPTLIKGKVIDETGGTLPDAIIKVKGSDKRFKTNVNGEFSVPANVGDELTFSFIGYSSMTVKIKDLKPLTVKLIGNAVSLGNVVVNGIFERKTSSYTGSAHTLQNKDLQKVSNMNILQALSVLDPAVQIPVDNLNGADPNKAGDIRLRGASSIPTADQLSSVAASTNLTERDMYAAYGKRVDEIKNTYNTNSNLPLFILDGFEVTLSQVTDMDMTMIKSVTILKDASSTAIYGSRGANGVIVIERIQPESSKVLFNYKADLTFNLPDLSDYQLLNAKEKLYAESLAGVYSSTVTAINENLKVLYNDRLREVERGRNFDWLSLPLRNSLTQRHGLTMSGNAANVGYGLDFTYNNNVGVIKGSGRESFNGGVYLNYRGKKFNLNNRTSIQFVNANNSPWGSYSQYVRMNPYFTPYDENGNIALYLQRKTGYGQFNSYGDIFNPVYNTTLNGKDFTKSKTIINNTAFTYNLNDNFSVRARLSLTNVQNDQGVFLPAGHTTYRQQSVSLLSRGGMTMGYGKTFSYDANVDINYNKQIGRHLISSTINTRAYENGYENVIVQVEGMPSSLTDYLFYARTYAGSRPDGSEGKTRTVGFLGNLNYTYDSRYFADFSYRLDGSSSLGSDRPFAPFWSVGAGWNIHNEKFMKDLLSKGMINQIRLRGSVGMTGSQQFDPYMAYRTYNYSLSEAYGVSIGASLLAIGNDRLRWQSTMKHNLGLDLTLLNSRLTFSGDLYYDYTDKFIADFSLPPSTGFSTYKGNLGSIDSRGWEFRASVQAIQSANPRGLSLSLFGNMSHNRTVIKEISAELKAQNDKLASTTSTWTPFTRYSAGAPINSLWVVPSLGIDPTTGKELYQKQDGTVSYVWDPTDMRNFGVSEPKYRGTFGFSINYLGFQLNSYLSYQFGGQSYNQTLVNRVENVDLVYNADRRVLTDRWTKPGDIAAFKSIAINGSNTNASSRFVQDDRTLTMTSASLLYRINPKYLKFMKVRQLNVGAYTSNLFRISTIKMERGLDYPFAQNLSLSVQASF